MDYSRSLFLFACLVGWCLGVRSPSSSGLPEAREAYLNGSSYMRMFYTISLHDHTGISFRSCVGGELFSQRLNGYSVQLSALADHVLLTFKWPDRPKVGSQERQQTKIETRLPLRPLNNRWHYVGLVYRPPELILSDESGHSVVVSNATYNPEILNTPEFENEHAVLQVGSMFSGCLLEGPGLLFNTSLMQHWHVALGKCPLSTDKCVDRKDVLTTPPVDRCYNEPCMRHGVCLSRPDRYECHCTARYSGNNCQKDDGPPCNSNPCLSGGHCEETKQGDYVCTCAQGFYGTNCEYEVHPLCTPNPCQNNGTCRVPANSNSYQCTCATGFTGSNCETNIDDCLTAPQPACQNGGFCQDALNNYTCICTNTGYTGARCEININECELQPGPCLNLGICFDTYGGYVCHCQPGYAGNNCQLNQNECLLSPCLNGGSCSDLLGSYRCQCPAGWSGPRCTQRRSPRCADCPPHSICGERGQCVCQPPYTGTPPNCTLMTGLECVTNPCQNGGTCNYDSVFNSFNCTCPSGFTGVYCEQAAAMPMSLSEAFGRGSSQCAHLPCVHASSCHQYPGGFYCECEPGWTGITCETDINECLSEPCQNGGECTQLINNFRCHCPPGFTGKVCQSVIDPCVGHPCQNAGECFTRGNGTDFMCQCKAGFDGPLCEKNIDDCLHITCPDHQICYDGINSYTCRCPDGYSGENCTQLTDFCSSSPCVNGTCHEGGNGNNYTCICQRGFAGRNCELDIDECKILGICNQGICVNKPGSYECYCKPGFTGENCDVDFDECLSRPCQNGGSCVNKINNYECICTPGFTGKDCSIDINECESNPCMKGSTCIDGMATFTCLCMEGLTGPTCEINIDDCESSPCLNGGVCEDGLNSFACNCSDTGHSGERCETNIDDCSPDPCVNGAVCVDGVKDYVCQCFLGYTGKNCDIDIPECESSPCQYRGVCLERSNMSLYRNTSFDPHNPKYVDEDLNMLLPMHFYQEFSYANASGFECVCIVGITGSHCETNINECESSPCGPWGVCVDRVGRYDCECEDGFEGDHCQRDIDECARYKPCVRGKCHDRRANYFCDCETGWGGKNCSVSLQGCQTNRCLNGGTCRPWLLDETQHRFNCTCSAGYHGDTCEMITTMSLGGHSYVIVNTSREEGYDIQFRFKTTLGNGLLAIGKGLTFYILELVNGRLNLHSSLLNKWEGVFIGSGLNDSNWQKVFVAINSSHLVLAANEEQTIYPINLNEGSNSSHTSFPTTYLGGTITSLSRLTHGPAAFIGCVQDVIINGKWVLPDNSTDPEASQQLVTSTSLAPVSVYSGTASWLLYGVQSTCPRVAQCAPNPCHSGGRCTDLWTSFHCTCQRPYLGHTCQYNVTAATFGYENTTDSLVTVMVHDTARRAVRSIVDISMFIRTRKPSGQIFYLGSNPKFGSSEETYVAASLENGELYVRLQFNQTNEAYTVGGNRLDNGFNHLIQVVRNSTLVQVKLNGSEYFRKPISATGQLDAQILYLGGPLPAPATRAVRQVDLTAPGPTPQPPTTADNFKGIIQDVQISNGSRVMIVEFFPLEVPELEMPPEFGEVSFQPNTVLEGIISDDSCAGDPCKHNAVCRVTWNDYRCECPRGYKGKSCQEMEFCQLQDCPGGSVCRDLDDGYECLANATLDGRGPPMLYSAHPNNTEIQADSITIMYRSKSGGTLLHIENAFGDMLSVSVYRDQVAVEWRQQPEQLPQVRRFRKHTPDYAWTRVHIHVGDKIIRGGFGDWMKEDTPAFTAEFDHRSWQDLLLTGEVLLGGVKGGSPNTTTRTPLTLTPPPDNESLYSANTVDFSGIGFSTEAGMLDDDAVDFWTGSDGTIGENYKGCLGEVRIGSILLPFYPLDELYPDASILRRRQRYALLSDRPLSGCALCFERDCLNGGRCQNPATSYACSCPRGYAGDDCSEDVDECIGAECANNATCIDGVGNYTCVCQTGWEGWLCDVDINECTSSPCENGGTCHDEPGGFTCACPEEVTGPRCSAPRLLTCAHRPCRRGSTCLQQKDEITGNNFTCSCMPGWEGVLCDTEYCVVKPCLNGAVCETIIDLPPSCKCPPGFTGRYCETNIDDCHIAGSVQTPCLNGGRCIDGIASYTCDCQSTGFMGVNCQEDIDECALGTVSCGEGGKCINTIGSFKCNCSPGLCGPTCAVIDPCYETHLVSDSFVSDEPTPANVTTGTPRWVRGPCQNGGACRELCADQPLYECECVDGWAGKNCTEQLAVAAPDDSVPIGIIIGCVFAGLCVMGGAGLVAACVLARTKRATRGTYSPSGQEYRNPRLEMLDSVLKPPPEERLI